MSRRSRFALLSGTAVTGVAFAAITLAFAPTASADPTLGTLAADPAAPTVGQTVQVSGGGCFDPLNQSKAAAAAAADPAATAADDPQPAGGTVDLTITGPDNFTTDATATASGDGSWSSTPFTIGDQAGQYTVNATCTLAVVVGQPVGYPYLPLTLDVTDPSTTTPSNPQVSCVACDNVTAGDAITVGGSGYPAGGTATIAVAGVTATTPIDGDGNLTPKSVTIPASTSPGTITGTVSSGSASNTFSVTVAKDTSVDGPVPGNPTTSPTGPSSSPTTGTGTGTGDGSGTGTSNSDNGGFDNTGSSQYASTPTYVASKPTLPSTGVDSLWPGVVGASLLVAGGGLVWLGRRRPEVGATV